MANSIKELSARIELLERDNAVLREKLLATQRNLSNPRDQKLVLRLREALRDPTSGTEKINQVLDEVRSLALETQSQVDHHLAKLESCLLCDTSVMPSHPLSTWPLVLVHVLTSEKDQPSKAQILQALKLTQLQQERLEQFDGEIRSRCQGLRHSIGVLLALRPLLQSRLAAFSDLVHHLSCLFSAEQQARGLEWIGTHPEHIQQMLASVAGSVTEENFAFS